MRVIQPNRARHHRCADHDQNRFHQPGCHAERDNGIAGADGFAGDRADDIGHCTGADGGNGCRIRIAEQYCHSGANDKRHHDARKNGNDARKPCFFEFAELDTEGCRHDRKITHHAATHQAYAAKQRDICDTASAARGHSAKIGGDEAERDGNS